jgi:hypothetical protein
MTFLFDIYKKIYIKIIMKRVLDFSGYSRIFEADPPAPPAPAPAAGSTPAPTTPAPAAGSTPAPTTPAPAADKKEAAPDTAKASNAPTAATSVGDQLYNAFVDIYFVLVSGIDGGYSDVVADLQSVSQQTDATKKGDTMADVLNKVSQKLNGDYKGQIGGDVKGFSDDLKKAYTTLVTSDEGKKSLDGINKRIDDSINKYVTELAAELKKAKAPVRESFQAWRESEQLNEGLFDKNLFPERRAELLSTIITPKMSQFKTIADTTMDSNYKQAAQKAYAEMNKLADELSKDDVWDKMKRRERKDRLEAIPGDVDKIQVAMNDATGKFTAQLKVDKEVSDSLTSVESKAKDIKSKAMELVNKQAAAEGKKKEEEAKKKEEEKKPEEKGDAPKEIKSGSIEKSNLKKSGANYQAIKDFQAKLNTILPKEQQIKSDGGYGTNTEQAIRRVAKLIGGSTGDDIVKATEDGKKLTPEFQMMVNNWTDPKIQAKIQELVSGKAK